MSGLLGITLTVEIRWPPGGVEYTKEKGRGKHMDL